MNKTNNFAVTSGDIGTAMAQTASIFNTAGIEMNEGISYIVAANESVQNASKVGTALKTITTNLQGIKTSAKDGSISLNKTSLALERVGISVKDSQGNIRDTTDILNDLGAKWDELSKTDKSAVSEAIAGKNHINTLQALMNNWETVVQYQKEYNEGAMVGSAAKENERYIDSIEGKITIMKENLTQLITTIASTDMFKNALDGINKFLEALNKVIGALDGKGGLLQSVALGGGISFMKGVQNLGTENSQGVVGFWTKIGNYWKEAQLKGQQLQGTMTQLNSTTSSLGSSSSQVASQTNRVNSVFSTLNQSASQTTSVFGDLSQNTTQASSSLSATSLALQRYNSTSSNTSQNTTQVSTAFQTLGTNATSAGENVQTTTSKFASIKNVGHALGNSLLGIGKNIATMGLNMVASTAAIWAMSAAFTAINNKIHETEIAFDKTQDAISETTSKVTGYRNTISSLSEISDQYDELSRKTNRTAEEEETLLSLRKQIADIAPDLVIGWDEENQPLLALNGTLEDYIDNLKQLKKLEETKQQAQENTAGRLALTQMASQNKLSYSTINPGFDFQNAETSFDSLNKTWYGTVANAEQYSKKYVQVMQNRNEEVNKKNEQLAESFSELAEYEASAQQYAMNKLDTNSMYKEWQNMSEKISGSMYSLVNVFDWSNQYADTEAEQNKFLQGFSKIAGYAEDNQGKMQDWISTIQTAQAVYQATGDADEFAQSIGGIADELENITGIDAEKWVAGLRGQLEGALDEEQMRLSEYLKSYGSSLQDYYNGEEQAVELHAKWVVDNTLAQALTDQNTSEEEKIQYIRAVVEGEIDATPEVERVMKAIYNDDKQISTAELQLATRLTAASANGGSMSAADEKMLNDILSGNYKGEITEDIVMSDGTIIFRETLQALQNEANHKPVEINAKLSEEEVVQQINKLTDDENHREILMSIKANIKDKDQLQDFDDLITGLQGSKENIQSVIQANIEGLSECETYTEMIEYLIDNGVIDTQCNVTIIGKDELKDLTETLQDEGLQNGVTSKIVADVQRGDLTSLIEDLNGIEDDEIRAKVMADITDALLGIGTVEAKTLRDKILKIKEEGGQYVLSVEEQVDNKSGNQTKKVEISAPNGPSTLELLESIHSQPETKSLVVSIGATVSNTLQTWWARLTNQSFGGGDGGEGGSGGSGLFRGISSNPFDAESPLSDQMYTATTLDMPEIDDSGLYEANATSTSTKNSWLNLSSNKTKDIKINVGLYGLKSLEQGIELMTTLDNQLSKIKNNVSLASAKLDNLYGTKRLSTMQNMVDSMKEQQRLLKQQYSYQTQQADKLRKVLSKSYGFKFNSDGNITNYLSQLTKMESKLQSLEKASSAKNAKDSVKKTYENYQDTYDTAKKYLEEYQDLQFNGIAQSKEEYEKLKKEIKETNDEIERIKFDDKIYKYVNTIESLSYKYDTLEESLKKLNAQLDGVHGQKQIDIIKQQLKLMEQQEKYLKSSLQTQNKELAQYQTKLKEYGFTFDKLGNISNYDTILNKFQNDDDLEKLKEYSDEYIDLHQNVLEAETSIIELDNEINNLNDDLALKKLEQATYKLNNAIEDTNKTLSKMEDEIDTLDTKLEYAFGTEKINLMNQKMSRYDDIIKETTNKLGLLTQTQVKYQKELEKYGFVFTDDGDIKNYTDAMNKLQNSSDYDYVKEILDGWQELDDEIGDTSKSLLEYSNTQKDIMKEKLDLTQDIEDKITSIYEDQLDKRKELIQKQADKEVEILEKVKDEYKKARDEEDYNESIKEQQKVIDELNTKIALAQKDTSLSGRATLVELMDKLEEENKNLQDLVKDRQDTLINDMLDEQIDKVNNTSEEKINQLEEIWSDSKIAEMVAQALGTGVFEDLDGNIMSLQDALLDFAETSGEAFGVMGDIVKNELVANLEVARDTIKEYSDIYNTLGLQAYGNNQEVYGTQQPANESKTINVDGIEIVINGDGANPEEIAEQVKITLDELLNDIINRT